MLPMNQTTLFNQIGDTISALYGSRDGIEQKQLERYARLLDTFETTFGKKEQLLYVSAPGRTEICGNHTDHNRGRVLAGSVNLDTLAVVSPRNDSLVTVNSEGHSPIQIDLDQLAMIEAEHGHAQSLVRGIAFWLKEHGYRIGGFDAVTTTGVFSGSGLSSSAAFEVLVCAIFETLYNDDTIGAVKRAQCGQYAENVYFGKPSGLMDQMACSMGGLIAIDFAKDEPKIEAIPYDFAAQGLCARGGFHRRQPRRSDALLRRHPKRDARRGAVLRQASAARSARKNVL